MRSRNHSIFTISKACASLALLASISCALPAKHPACVNPIRIEVNKKILMNAVAQVLSKFNSASSIGWIDYDIAKRQYQPAAWLTLNIEACTINEALDALVDADGHYKWETRNESVVFIPISDPSNLRVVERLSQKLKQFEVRSATIDEAFRNLVLEIQREGIRGFSTVSDDWPIESPKSIMRHPYKVTLNLKGRTILECIIAINLAFGRAHHWIARPVTPDSIQIRPGNYQFSTWPVSLSDEEFEVYKRLTDRLAELRGREVVSGLSDIEASEKEALSREYRSFMWEHAEKRYQGIQPPTP